MHLFFCSSICPSASVPGLSSYVSGRCLSPPQSPHLTMRLTLCMSKSVCSSILPFPPCPIRLSPHMPLRLSCPCDWFRNSIKIVLQKQGFPYKTPECCWNFKFLIKDAQLPKLESWYFTLLYLPYYPWVDQEYSRFLGNWRLFWETLYGRKSRFFRNPVILSKLLKLLKGRVNVFYSWIGCPPIRGVKLES